MSRLPWRQVAALAAELLLAASVAALLLALAWAHNVTFDLTPTKDHTLSDAARRVADRLDQDVEVTVFFNGQDQGKIREMRELLRRFGDQSSRFRFRMVDLDRNPLLANSMGVVNYDTAVVDGYGRRARGVKVTEGDLTTELIRLVEGRERVAVFAVGHGEHDPGDTDPRAGLSQASKALEAENFRVERAADLRGGVQPDASLLVVANPTSDFTESEIEAVRGFLRADGGALFLLEAGVPPRVA
ncbi:MAG: Gldg family protein, partial [Alphaproteobacteria bacterium]